MFNPHSGIARIFKNSNYVIGAGFLIDDQHLVTCTHVVEQALKISFDETPPKTNIKVDFPLAHNQPSTTAKVIKWFSPRDRFGDDISILKITTNLDYVQPFDFGTHENDWNKSFRAYGFPHGYTSGVWVEGILRDKIEGERVQVEINSQTGYSIERGFSGTPIMDSLDPNRVLGMIASADLDTNIRAAFMIPAEKILAVLHENEEFEDLDLAVISSEETLYTNLLKIDSFSEYIYSAEALSSSATRFAKSIEQAGITENEWLFKNGRIFTFHDLENPKWSDVCDNENIELFETEEWAFSDSEALKNDFVELLNKSLKSMVAKDLVYDDDRELYYFRPSRNLADKSYRYRSVKLMTQRYVFRRYGDDSSGYYRHSAFAGNFRRYGELWYLQIVPSYYFSSDGYIEHRNASGRPH